MVSISWTWQKTNSGVQGARDHSHKLQNIFLVYFVAHFQPSGDTPSFMYFLLRNLLSDSDPNCIMGNPFKDVREGCKEKTHKKSEKIPDLHFFFFAPFPREYLLFQKVRYLIKLIKERGEGVISVYKYLWSEFCIFWSPSGYKM